MGTITGLVTDSSGAVIPNAVVVAANTATGGKAQTIYFIVPANEMKAKASYIRLALSSALRGLYRHDGVPTTVILEEAYVTGYHEEIEQALSILRGYGSRLTVVS